VNDEEKEQGGIPKFAATASGERDPKISQGMHNLVVWLGTGSLCTQPSSQFEELEEERRLVLFSPWMTVPFLA